ncbi:MAG: HNH endonuclease [Deltaproteobacteria bacterium]|nr:HNH endonuclease [Deltaproteobacteria bacterium]
MPAADRSTLRDTVERRARGRCEYCRSPARYSTYTFSLDHIVPRSQGGVTSLDNLALACQGCNSHKYNKTQSSDPFTKQRVNLFHPREQRWQEHFAWDEQFERILGVTASGRATVEALQLNRAELLNLRKLLYTAGEHPLPDVDDTPDVSGTL